MYRTVIILILLLTQKYKNSYVAILASIMENHTSGVSPSRKWISMIKTRALSVNLIIWFICLP